MKRSRGKRLALSVGALGLVCTVLLGPHLGGLVRLNTPGRTQCPVWGVDVSEYQGDIDWQALAAQGVQFAFIKATEGSGYEDPCFAPNWQGAQEAGVPAGAYHFFSFESAGATQAENLLKVLPIRAGMLPPVVDVELYGEYRLAPADAQTVRAEQRELLARIEEACGQKPILYTTQRAYRLYLRGEFDAYPLWMRDVFTRPIYTDWTFWQYSDKGKLEGYEGPEQYIDLNVFNGDREDWEAFLTQCSLH